MPGKRIKSQVNYSNLVVADPERSDKTIVLQFPGNEKTWAFQVDVVFEIPKGIEYIMAPPRMQLYIDYW